MIKHLADQHDVCAISTMRAKWDTFFTAMKKNGIFAEGPVLYVAAILLRLDIAVISFGNTITNPYMLVPGHSSETPTPPPIFLGNQIDLHFQSFLPDSRAPQEDLMMLMSEVGAPKMIEQVSTPTSILLTPSSKTSTANRQLPPRKSLFKSSLQSKKKNLRGVREVGKMGDEVIANVTSLVRENRRLHALVQTLEFQVSRCSCHGSERIEVKDEFDSVDAVSDDVLASTPL